MWVGQEALFQLQIPFDSVCCAGRYFLAWVSWDWRRTPCSEIYPDIVLRAVTLDAATVLLCQPYQFACFHLESPLDVHIVARVRHVRNRLHAQEKRVFSRSRSMSRGRAPTLYDEQFLVIASQSEAIQAITGLLRFCSQ